MIKKLMLKHFTTQQMTGMQWICPPGQLSLLCLITQYYLSNDTAQLYQMLIEK